MTCTVTCAVTCAVTCDQGHPIRRHSLKRATPSSAQSDCRQAVRHPPKSPPVHSAGYRKALLFIRVDAVGLHERGGAVLVEHRLTNHCARRPCCHLPQGRAGRRGQLLLRAAHDRPLALWRRSDAPPRALLITSAARPPVRPPQGAQSHAAACGTPTPEPPHRETRLEKRSHGACGVYPDHTCIAPRMLTASWRPERSARAASLT